MSAYKHKMRSKAKEKGDQTDDKIVLGGLYDIYYNNRDLRSA